MPQISAIEPQKKKKGRYNIYIDGRFAVGLGAEALAKSSLKIGQEISGAQIRQLIFENEVNKLIEKAYRFLSYRPRSEREIRDYLRKKAQASSPKPQISFDTAIDEVLGRLRDQGYVNDIDFTRWWVEQRQEHKPRGQRLIRSELLQKGVPQKTIDEVLGEFADPEKEIKRATAAAQKKLPAFKTLKPWEFKRKMANYLARRGFEREIISEVLESLC